MAGTAGTREREALRALKDEEVMLHSLQKTFRAQVKQLKTEESALIRLLKRCDATVAPSSSAKTSLWISEVQAKGSNEEMHRAEESIDLEVNNIPLDDISVEMSAEPSNNTTTNASVITTPTSEQEFEVETDEESSLEE